ncbi:MAG: YqiJ family protein [Aestuariibacter sp.]|nr:YqiJ family protein [Aestuariibacter sp.]
MFEFILATGNTPFAVALTVMFGIAILEGVTTLLGFAFSNVIDALIPEFDMDIDAGFDADIDATAGSTLEHGHSADLGANSALSRLLGWLRVGRVPVLILLVVFLTGFGLTGLALQSFVHGITGSLLPGSIMSIPAFIIALPIVHLLGGVIGKIMPKDETDAVTEESLVGRVATITLGTARSGSPAEARVRDIHGTTHYVMVEPGSVNAEFHSGSSVLLLQKNGAIFKGIVNPNPALVD